MRHFFLDTNVVLDVLAKRHPFAPIAVQLFERAFQGQVTLYVASLSFSNMHYILQRAKTPPAVALELLTDLAQLVQIVGVDASVMQQALASGSSDFEDALQYFTAASVPAIEAIVTRDPKGFRTSSLPVFSPAKAIAQLL